MKIIFGLGNYGKDYDKTRHNMGFMFLDYITNNAQFNLNKKMNSMEYVKNYYDDKVIFVKPLSFMNLSGEVVKKYLDYYKASLDDILVIQDDLDMPLGRFKLLYNHGDGGHNGIKNIILNVGDKKFIRLKFGISKRDYDVRDYVLGKFSSSELDLINSTFLDFDCFLDDYFSLNRDRLFGKYNSLNSSKEG